MLRATAAAHCGVRGPFEEGNSMRLIPWRELTALVRHRVGRTEDEQARRIARGGEDAERAESVYWSVLNDVRQVIDEERPRPRARRRRRRR